MTATLDIDFPATLLLHARDAAALTERSRFLLALKFFELGELSSGQAARMCGLGRVQFLDEAARCGVPVTELTGEELKQEFGDA
jgi:predicted HTH domain antitoxin